MLTPIRKYNFWDENPIDLGYPRTFYTDKIGQYIDNKLIVINVLTYLICVECAWIP